MSFFSRLFKRKPAPTLTFAASNTSEIKDLLTEGRVTFIFKTKKGAMRKAIGTTNLSLIRWQDHPLGMKNQSPKAVPFYDLELKQWRSMSAGAECFIA